MKYHDPNKKNGTIATRAMCAIVFMLFTFTWLYEFQADALTVAQHVLSDGQTSYNRTVGAVLITLVLQLLQLGVYAVVRLSHRTHALTYFPSMLMLAVLSDISPDIDQHFSFGAWAWVVPLLLMAWGGCVWLARQMLPFGDGQKPSVGLFSQHMWLNLLQMAAMMLGVAWVANTNAVFHYRLHAEVSLLNGNVDEALRVGQRSLETDENLTMLRAFALSQQGQLPERLFTYPIKGTSADLLPLRNSHSRLMLLPDSVLWQHFSMTPMDSVNRQSYTTAQYLDSLQNDTLATRVYADYQLCGYLIDRQLDAFAEVLPMHYTANSDSLPLHYREALVLCQQRGVPLPAGFDYNDTTVTAQWHAFHRYDSIYSNLRERQIRCEEHFLGTYWYYFQFATTAP